MNALHTWRTAHRERDLPTYRQIDYWCRTGAITPTGDARGSGSRREWTDHQLDKLEAIGRLYRAFVEFGIGAGLPNDLVGEIWDGLDGTDTYVISFGNSEGARLKIRIEVSV